MASKSTSGPSLNNTDDCGSSSRAFQRKRPAEGSSGKAEAVPKVDHDFEDLAKVTPSSNAAVHGILLDLSPMKRSKNDGPYFEGHIVDNSKRQLRFVGFSASQHASISALKTEEEPVAILGCQVKQTASKDMELAEITGIQQDDIDVEALLTSAPCCIKSNDRQVITNVYWKQ